MLTRRETLLSASALALSGCATATAPRQGAANDQNTAALNTFLDEAFDARLARQPEFATQLADRRNYDRWNEETEEDDANELAITRQTLAEMRSRFSTLHLNENGRLSFRLFEAQAARQEATYPFRNHLYRFDQMNGAQSDLPAFLINNHAVTNVSDAEAYVSRIERFQTKMSQLLARSEASAAMGVMPPRFVYDYVLRDCRNVIAGAPFETGADSPLWADFTGKVNALAPETASSEEKERLIAAGRAAFNASLKPAYEEAIRVLTAQQQRAGDDDGVWRFPDAAAFYAQRLNFYTTTDMSADDIHRTGLEEVARIHGEMDAIKNRVNFSGSRMEFFEFMRTDPRFYVEDSAAGRASYVARATAAIDAMRTRLPDAFRRLPRADLVVRQVEAFREQSSGLAFYERPAPDGSRPGVYYVNTYIVRAIPTYQLEALAYHEGIPGHHMQIAIAQELEGIPNFRKFASFYAAYSEGWGLYSEYLPKEMGFYTDPYSDFGRLTMELHRAVRLVVDTGIHHLRWTRQQAIDYTLANKPDVEPQARRDIDRYIVYPGQATAYKIGMMEILRLRELARSTMGARFDIRDFHDVVLRNGAIPLHMLRDQISAYAGWAE
ncbi:MAG: DUF885 family protein [Hyphomonadaceae bacterium]